jgi:hypothetical protein
VKRAPVGGAGVSIRAFTTGQLQAAGGGLVTIGGAAWATSTDVSRFARKDDAPEARSPRAHWRSRSLGQALGRPEVCRISRIFFKP